MNKKGFTLIELLVVIVILAIIALITVPNALAMITTAQTRANERSAESFFRAAEAYCLAVRTASPTASAPTGTITAIPGGNPTIDVRGNAPASFSITFNANTCTASGTVTYGTTAVTR